MYSFTDRKKALTQYPANKGSTTKRQQGYKWWEEASIEDLESGKYEII